MVCCVPAVVDENSSLPARLWEQVGRRGRPVRSPGDSRCEHGALPVSAVEECQLDENSMLIPIAVGGALAGLVLIVLIAYLIGRKRSHAGYQTI